MKEYKLEIDPRILELLGPNLYTNIYYVLAELIANAYDADAQNVYVIAGKDDIRVEDDGHGMSYEHGEINSYLKVAAVSRTNSENSLTRSRLRMKMGRKGVGKLAALSVSENVDVLTISNGERSGFVLSRTPDEGNRLQAIPDEDVKFQFIEDHGSAIIMRNPSYRLHTTLQVIKNNIIKMFPQVGNDFRIHIIRGKERKTLSSFDAEIINKLGTIITLGNDFSHLANRIPREFPEKHHTLALMREAYSKYLDLRDIHGNTHKYELSISGWIGTYKTTSGSKKNITDFPDNFISLFSHKKLGEFNILPLVGKNKLSEVFVVGQLHIDLFEETELPDMALSNRQGYKSDDPRHEAVVGYVRDKLLPDILNLRIQYANLRKSGTKSRKQQKEHEEEIKFKKSVDLFREKTSAEIASKISEADGTLSSSELKDIISSFINKNSPNLGLKPKIDSQKKKLLISHTGSDKIFSDLIYDTLLFNNAPKDDILYTSCDDEACRIPINTAVYDYLRTFFVESYSDQKIYVLFVTSKNMGNSWGAITEVGASWITKADHLIFNIDPFKPMPPLDTQKIWQSTNISEIDGAITLSMSKVNADTFCQFIESTCKKLGYEHKSREENMDRLQGIISISSK